MTDLLAKLEQAVAENDAEAVFEAAEAEIIKIVVKASREVARQLIGLFWKEELPAKALNEAVDIATDAFGREVSRVLHPDDVITASEIFRAETLSECLRIDSTMQDGGRA